MRESGYYPEGAEFDINAPYNQPQFDGETIETNVCISNTLSKNTKLPISRVFVHKDKCYETNDEGGIDYYEDIKYDYSNCDLNNDYRVEEFTILELLCILKEYVNQDLANNKSNLSISSLPKRYNLNTILKSLEGWSEDELEVIPE